jgi:hypothetical protein
MRPRGSRGHRSWKRWLLVAFVGFVVLVGFGSAYVAIPVARELDRASDVLTGPARALGVEEIEGARDHLLSAEARLDGIVAKFLGLLPVARQSLGAARDVVGAAVPVVETAADLRSSLDSLAETDLIASGRVRLEELLPLAEDLRRQSETLTALAEASDGALGGWVVPPVWERAAELSARAEDLAATTGAAGELVDALPAILGEEDPRRYLLLLLNNAELRGAGGILSAVGTMRAIDGRLSLRTLTPREALVTDPLVEVPAPEPYERLYAVAGANTSLWVNVPYSPDLEHTAAVAAALWEETLGQNVSGVLFVDPRGLAALLEPDTTLTIAETTEVTAAELPDFVYSDAYQLFASQSERREAILEAGGDAFTSFLESGADGEDGIRAMGDAVAGGHLAFVSLRPEEQSLLRSVTTAHTEPGQVRVVTQNLGDGEAAGTKLDYWVERELVQECNVADDGSATCSTGTSLTNGAPDGLGRYVGGRPYGVFRSDVQTFLPKGSHVVEVTLDGEPAPALVRGYGATPVVTVYARIEQGDAATVEVVYEVPARAEGDFRLELVPQPLARDARLEVRLSLPRSWRARDLEVDSDGIAERSVVFDRPVTLAAAWPERAGLPALWERLKSFWEEPVF